MSARGFWRQSALLFAALRAGDLLNLAAALWLVPRFVDSDSLGALLPVTTFATVLAIPAFAFAMTVMRESAVLAFRGERGKLKSLLRGVFAGTAGLFVLALLSGLFLVPRFLAAMRVPDAPAAFFAAVAAFLGCLAPVCTDALNALKRFRALAAVEVLSAAVRFAALALLLPIRAFAGFFLANALQPLARMVLSVGFLRRDLAVPAETYWTRETLRRLLGAFAAVTAYQLAPMLAALAEQSVLRTNLPADVSAGYYLATRLADALGYVTLPVLFVLFPYAADEAAAKRPVRPYVLRCAAFASVAALLWGGILAVFGKDLLALLPQGADHAALAPRLPLLVLLNLLGILQVFATNALVAAGSYRFLAWFVPLSLADALALGTGLVHVRSFGALLGWMVAFAAVRAACAFASAMRR